jgi:hypothetical protein
MQYEAYRYVFAPGSPIEDVEASLLLALLAVESLHGEAQVRLDAAHVISRDRRVCVIDAGTAVGQDLNRLFVTFLRREFGDDAFLVDRLVSDPPQPSQGNQK